MTNSGLLSRVVELAITYLMHSTVFLGTVGIVLAVAARIRRHREPSKFRQFNPVIEEQLWKLAATLPLFSIPLCFCAGSSCELSAWQFPSHIQPSSTTVLAVDPSNSAESSIITSATPGASELEAQESGPSSRTAANDFSQSSRSTQIETLVNFDPPSADFERHRDEPKDHQTTASLRDEASIGVDPQQLSTGSTVPFPWHCWMGLALLSWIALATLRLFIRAVLVKRILSRCQPATEDLEQALNRVAKRSRRIRLLTAPINAVREPFACGIWHWTIVLPPSIEQQLTPAELKALLAHELAHLVRRDPLWLFVGELLCTAFAFQPLNFIARRRWLQAAELLCDDWAVQQDVPAISLAACLTRIAELRLDRRGETWGLAAGGRSGLLMHRVEWLLREGRATEATSRRSRLRTRIAIVGLAILVGAFGPRLVLPDAAEAADAIEDSSEQIAIENELFLALNELEQTEKLLKNDQDARTAVIASRLRLRIQSIRDRLGN